MPTMPRTDSKETKIAYKIVGKPVNIAHKRTEREKYINRRLIFEETNRAR